MEYGMSVDLEQSYGLTCRDVAPLPGGWLNRLWRVSTNQGDLLVKQFSTERFSPEQLAEIEDALQRQLLVERDGVPCPRILLCGGRAIRLPENLSPYMVMGFSPGAVEHPDTITAGQMRSLGDACGRMHRSLLRLPEPADAGRSIGGRQMIDGLYAHYRGCVEECAEEVPARYRQAVHALEPILRRLTPEFFDRLSKGFGHEDFTSDNILFDEGGVTAIIDFDRCKYSYIWHDVGRALLSFAWDGREMDLAKAGAFVEGYSRHFALSLPDIADALRISWCIEIPWWIQPPFFSTVRGKAIRFRDEILWVMEHWDRLDSLFRPAAPSVSP